MRVLSAGRRSDTCVPETTGPIGYTPEVSWPAHGGIESHAQHSTPSTPSLFRQGLDWQVRATPAWGRRLNQTMRTPAAARAR